MSFAKSMGRSTGSGSVPCCALAAMYIVAIIKTNTRIRPRFSLRCASQLNEQYYHPHERRMKMNEPIPHSAVVTGSEEQEAVSRVIASGRLAQGPEVDAFEAECASRLGRAHGVAVSSGTAGLHLALRALGARDVAYPAYACAALRTAADLAGAESLLCDVGDDFNAKDVPQASAAIIPHLFGARAHLPGDVPVIEDIAQSIGAD